MRKAMLIFTIMVWTLLVNAENSENIHVQNFFYGIGTASIAPEDAAQLIANDKIIQDKMQMHDAQIVAIMDTGKRYRCMCGDYLVKYADKQNKFWIEEVSIKNRKVVN